MSLAVSLRKQLPGVEGSEVHAVRADPELLEKALQGLGFKVYVLEGKRMTGKRSFLDEVGRCLEFIPYLGHTWDDFASNFPDLNEQPERRVAFLWKDADRLFASDAQAFVDATVQFAEFAVQFGSCHAGGMEPMQMEVFLLGRGRGFKARLELGGAPQGTGDVGHG